MATVTHAISTASTAGGTSYASGAFTPAADDLLVAFVFATSTVATGTMTDSQSLGFTKVTSAVKGGTAHTLYAFVANALAAASSMTVTFDCTGDPASGAIVQVARIAGMSKTGLTAILQSAKLENQSAGGTPTATFPASALTGNPTLGAVGNGTNPATVTNPSGWTERADAGYSVPDAGQEYVSRDSGFTGTVITWGSTSASTFCDLIVELDASGAGTAANAGNAAGTGTAHQPAISLDVNAGLASGTGVAYDATVLTGAAPEAGHASGTGTAYGPSTRVEPAIQAASGTGTANAPSASVGTVAGSASGDGTAYGPATDVGAQAGNAGGTASAGAPTAALGVNAAAALLVGAAFDATGAVAAFAGLASGTGLAFDPTVEIIEFGAGTNAPAGHAAGIGQAFDATVAILTFGEEPRRRGGRRLGPISGAALVSGPAGQRKRGSRTVLILDDPEELWLLGLGDPVGDI